MGTPVSSQCPNVLTKVVGVSDEMSDRFGQGTIRQTFAGDDHRRPETVTNACASAGSVTVIDYKEVIISGNLQSVTLVQRIGLWISRRDVPLKRMPFLVISPIRWKTVSQLIVYITTDLLLGPEPWRSARQVSGVGHTHIYISFKTDAHS